MIHGKRICDFECIYAAKTESITIIIFLDKVVFIPVIFLTKKKANPRIKSNPKNDDDDDFDFDKAKSAINGLLKELENLSEQEKTRAKRRERINKIYAATNKLVEEKHKIQNKDKKDEIAEQVRENYQYIDEILDGKHDKDN